MTPAEAYDLDRRVTVLEKIVEQWDGILKGIEGTVVLILREQHKQWRDIELLKSDVTVLKSDVAVLKSDVAVLKSDVAGLKSDMADVKISVAKIEEILITLVNKLS